MGEYDAEYDQLVREAQDAIKQRAQVHNQQAASYLTQYNQSNPNNQVHDTSKQYLVSNGNYGSRKMSRNVLADNALAHGAGKPSTTTGSTQTTTTTSTKPKNPAVEATYAKIGNAYDQYKAGTMSYEDFYRMANMSPEQWEQQLARQERNAKYEEETAKNEAIDSNLRTAMANLNDEERHRLEAEMEDNYIYPGRSDFSVDSARAAIAAQEKGKSLTDRYKKQLEQMQKENATTPSAPAVSTSPDNQNANNSYVPEPDPYRPPTSTVEGLVPEEIRQREEEVEFVKSRYMAIGKSEEEAERLAREEVYDQDFAPETVDDKAIDAARANIAKIVDWREKNGHELGSWERKFYASPDRDKRVYDALKFLYDRGYDIEEPRLFSSEYDVVNAAELAKYMLEHGESEDKVTDFLNGRVSGDIPVRTEPASYISSSKGNPFVQEEQEKQKKKQRDKESWQRSWDVTKDLAKAGISKGIDALSGIGDDFRTAMATPGALSTGAELPGMSNMRNMSWGPTRFASKPAPKVPDSVTFAQQRGEAMANYLNRRGDNTTWNPGEGWLDMGQPDINEDKPNAGLVMGYANGNGANSAAASVASEDNRTWEPGEGWFDANPESELTNEYENQIANNPPLDNRIIQILTALGEYRNDMTREEAEEILRRHGIMQ